MEMSKEFAEKQMMLHKTEFENWSKIVKSFTVEAKQKLTKKEKEIIERNEFKNKFFKNRKKSNH